MTTRDHIIEDERDERVVRDGERINVPLFLMDGVQREVADTSPLSEEDQRIAAYDEYCHYISNAWRGPEVRPPTPKATFVSTGDARVRRPPRVHGKSARRLENSMSIISR